MYLVVPTSTLRSQSIGLMNIGRLGAVHTTHAPAQSTNSPPIKNQSGQAHAPTQGRLTAPSRKRGSPAQKHFRCTMVGPDSSYSALEIHICWKVLSEERMDPPIHTEYLRSGGATTLIFMVDGARAVSSFVMRSPMPKNIVVPPDSTTLAYRSLRMSTSHFMIDWNVVSWIPLASFPMKLGWNRTSGQRKRSLPTVMMLPSGSS